jgi:hypothetical protein
VTEGELAIERVEFKREQLLTFIGNFREVLDALGYGRPDSILSSQAYAEAEDRFLKCTLFFGGFLNALVVASTPRTHEEHLAVLHAMALSDEPMFSDMRAPRSLPPTIR